jgi:hypothetical protein
LCAEEDLPYLRQALTFWEACPYLTLDDEEEVCAVRVLLTGLDQNIETGS